MTNKVKVIISSLPPRYMEDGENWQYTEHSDINNLIVENMTRYQVDSAGVALAGQARLACPPGFIRERRYRESGALSEQGMFLFLKNTVAVLKHPAKPRADTMCSG